MGASFGGVRERALTGYRHCCVLVCVAAASVCTILTGSMRCSTRAWSSVKDSDVHLLMPGTGSDRLTVVSPLHDNPNSSCQLFSGDSLDQFFLCHVPITRQQARTRATMRGDLRKSNYWRPPVRVTVSGIHKLGWLKDGKASMLEVHRFSL